VVLFVSIIYHSRNPFFCVQGDFLVAGVAHFGVHVSRDTEEPSLAAIQGSGTLKTHEAHEKLHQLWKHAPLLRVLRGRLQAG
jgi:hypothetical protein